MTNLFDRSPVAQDLSTWPSDDPHLLGGQCATCDTMTFPSQSSCPKCGAGQMQVGGLATRGTLWSWTVQGFPPKSPPYDPDEAAKFEPFGVGYVDLAGQLKVETSLTEASPERLAIGMEVGLVIVPFADKVTFA